MNGDKEAADSPRRARLVFDRCQEIGLYCTHAPTAILFVFFLNPTLPRDFIPLFFIRCKTSHNGRACNRGHSFSAQVFRIKRRAS